MGYETIFESVFCGLFQRIRRLTGNQPEAERVLHHVRGATGYGGVIIWLVGGDWNMTFIFPEILGIIIPID